MIVTYAQFEKYCEDNNLPKRAWSKGEWEALHTPQEKKPGAEPPPMQAIEHANREHFKKYCRESNLDPTTSVTSPMLRRLIDDQNAGRCDIDARDEI